MNQATGVIGIPCRVQGRWSPFWQCLNRLERPADVWIEPAYDNSVARSRNDITKKALAMGADWIFWLDDDLLFAPDVLTKLLAHPEEIIIGLTLMRMKMAGQFKPIWSTEPLNVGGGEASWVPIERIETGSNGLMRLRSGTGGGCLTRTSVFAKMEAPWWRQGQYVPDMFWEDIWFYEAAKFAGISVWGDPNVRFGHISDLVMWPHQDANGQWMTVLADGFNGWLTMPWQVPVGA